MKREWCVTAMAVLAVLMATGCRPEAAEQKELTPDSLAVYASLPGLRRSTNRALRAELARLEKAKATPADLAKPDDPALLSDGHQPTRDSRVRATRALVNLLPPRRRRQWMEEIAGQFPRAACDVDPADLAAYREVLRRWAVPLEKAEVLLARPDFGLYIAIDQGLLADVTCVDVVRTLVRQECLMTVVGVLEENLTESLVHWNRGGKFLQELASLPHAVSRTAAARARMEWLRIGQSVLHSPLAGPDTFAAVAATLQDHLDDWPDDAVALNGDRAVGLHTYELLREGYWMSLLTLRELQEMRARKLVKPFVVHVATHLDDDELFYLQAMREMIAASRRPYPERLEVFESLDKRIDELRGTPQYPWFAAEFLLDDDRRLQRWQASDLQLTKALHAAIQAALYGPPSTPIRDPLTGEPWVWKQDRDEVILTNVLWPIDDSPIRLPVVPPTARAAQRR